MIEMVGRTLMRQVSPQIQLREKQLEKRRGGGIIEGGGGRCQQKGGSRKIKKKSRREKKRERKNLYFPQIHSLYIGKFVFLNQSVYFLHSLPSTICLIFPQWSLPLFTQKLVVLIKNESLFFIDYVFDPHKFDWIV